ncbi:MAG: SLC13 family permease [Pirellulales bacterium]
MGDRLIGLAGRSETRLLAVLMAAVALLGAFMSSTGVVAIFVPIVLRIAVQLQIPPGRLMMPLAFGGLISGMLTLVATAPNMVVDGVLRCEGFAGFRFLSFTPIGLVVLAAGVGYMLCARKLLKTAADDAAPGESKPTITNWIRDYGLTDRVARFRVPPASPLVGKELHELDLRGRYLANVVGVERRSRFHQDIISPGAHMRLHANDILFVFTHAEVVDFAAPVHDLELVPLALRSGAAGHKVREVGMAEVLVPPDSKLIGKTLTESEFRRRFHLNVLGLRRAGKPVREPLLDEKLKMGDVLLAIGPWKAIRALQAQQRELLVLTLPAEVDQVCAGPQASRRTPWHVSCS